MHRLYLIFLNVLVFCSCSDNKNEKIEYYEFKKQITPSERFAIYEFARAGSMAFSSDIHSVEVFPIDEKFHEGKGEKIEGSISHWINDDTLLVYDFRSDLVQPLDTLPLKITHRKYGDFVVKTINYKANYGGTNRFTFDSVWTNKTHIYIRFDSGKRKNNVRTFPLGSVIVKTNLDSIKSIEVFGEVTKDMKFTYKNPDGTISNGLPGIGTTTYEYTPTKKISPKGLNKTKIFYAD